VGAQVALHGLVND